MDIISIPKRYFNVLSIVEEAGAWVNGKYVENTTSIEFQGALFDLSKSDYRKLQSQNTTLGFEDRKLYTKEDINFNLKMTVKDHLGNRFRVVGVEDYRQNSHADLKILYLERFKDEQD